MIGILNLSLFLSGNFLLGLILISGVVSGGGSVSVWLVMWVCVQFISGVSSI